MWDRAEGLPEEGEELVGMRTPAEEALEALLPASLRIASEQTSPWVWVQAGESRQQPARGAEQRGVARAGVLWPQSSVFLLPSLPGCYFRR